MQKHKHTLSFTHIKVLILSREADMQPCEAAIWKALCFFFSGFTLTEVSAKTSSWVVSFHISNYPHLLKGKKKKHFSKAWGSLFWTFHTGLKAVKKLVIIHRNGTKWESEHRIWDFKWINPKKCIKLLFYLLNADIKVESTVFSKPSLNTTQTLVWRMNVMLRWHTNSSQGLGSVNFQFTAMPPIPCFERTLKSKTIKLIKLFQREFLSRFYWKRIENNSELLDQLRQEATWLV